MTSGIKMLYICQNTKIMEEDLSVSVGITSIVYMAIGLFIFAYDLMVGIWEGFSLSRTGLWFSQDGWIWMFVVSLGIWMVLGLVELAVSIYKGA